MTQVHQTTDTTPRVDIGPAGVKLCEALLDAATGFGKLDKDTAPVELYRYIADAVLETAPREEGEGVDIEEFVKWGKDALAVLTEKVSNKVTELGGGELIEALKRQRQERGPSVH